MLLSEKFCQLFLLSSYICCMKKILYLFFHFVIMWCLSQYFMLATNLVPLYSPYVILDAHLSSFFVCVTYVVLLSCCAEPGKLQELLHFHFHGTKQFLVKFSSRFQLLPFIFVILTLLPLALGDLNSDKQALLAFAAAVPHGPKLNWNPATPVCTSWVGINCTRGGTRVLSLRLPGVGLVGPIPANTLGKLDALRVLSLRSNLLNGKLPSDIASLPSLHYLFLQHNNLTGDIPTSLSPQLNVLDLSFNSFTGNIPLRIHNLTRLTGLGLQNNSLYGAIPNFTFPRLRRLNLSYNHLNGSIPPSLQQFLNSSFVENSCLCGLPLNPCSSLSPSPADNPPPPKETSKKVERSSGLLLYLRG